MAAMREKPSAADVLLEFQLVFMALNLRLRRLLGETPDQQNRDGDD